MKVINYSDWIILEFEKKKTGTNHERANKRFAKLVNSYMDFACAKSGQLHHAKNQNMFI